MSLLSALLGNLHPSEFALTGSVACLLQPPLLFGGLVLLGRDNAIMFVLDEILTLKASACALGSTIPYLTTATYVKHYNVTVENLLAERVP